LLILAKEASRLQNNPHRFTYPGKISKFPAVTMEIATEPEWTDISKQLQKLGIQKILFADKGSFFR
jgi:hypothetical protein